MDDRELTFIDALLTGDTGAAIERSEKRGQEEVVNNIRLPKKQNEYSIPSSVREEGTTKEMDFKTRFDIEHNNNIKATKEQYERMGITIKDDHDDLFYSVTLPDGWSIRPTEHTMWNDVIDSKRRKRITFFYKAAFYDRDAFANFEKRFSIGTVPFDGYKTEASYEERKSKEWFGVVEDCGKEIFRTQGKLLEGEYAMLSITQTELINECKEFLNNKYPGYDDINAYWD